MLVHQHCCLPRYFIGLCTFAMVILCAVSPEPACSLKITSDYIYYYQARGRSVSLNCEFTLDSDDLDSLDIEWNIVLPDKQETEKLLLWYAQSLIHNNLYGPLKNRLFFTSPEPQDGDASLTITDLKLTDSGTYQCKVRYLHREQFKRIFLVVMESPDKPVCYMDDEPVLGTNIRLRCTSSQGTPPLKYTWAKLSRNQMLPPDAFVDAHGGDLYLDKITERDSGAYRCTVQNLVGMEECELILEITSPSTVIGRHGPTAGTAAGITAGAIVALIVLITVTLTPVIYYRRRKRHERAKIPPCQCRQTKSCICRSRRTEQLWCEEEDHLFEIMETNSTVRSSSAEASEKSPPIEEGLTACVEAKIEKSEDKGTREEAADEGQEPCSSSQEKPMDEESLKVLCSMLT